MRVRRAFTIIELLMVMVIMGIMVAMVVPKFRVSPKQHARIAARQLMRDFELARNRALSTKRITRVAFTVASNTYTAYGDDDGNGAFTESTAETVFASAFGTRVLDNGVILGRGIATSGIPGEASSGAVTLPSAKANFDTRGLPTPFGTKGTVYITTTTDTRAVFAVELSAAGSYRLWTYLPNGTWQ